HHANQPVTQTDDAAALLLISHDVTYDVEDVGAQVGAVILPHPEHRPPHLLQRACDTAKADAPVPHIIHVMTTALLGCGASRGNDAIDDDLPALVHRLNTNSDAGRTFVHHH